MKKGGFTLIEVMVALSVIALIAVLAYTLVAEVFREAKLTRQATMIGRQI